MLHSIPFHRSVDNPDTIEDGSTSVNNQYMDKGFLFSKSITRRKEKMQKKTVTLALFAILLLSMTVLTTTARGADDGEIEASGAAAVAYLASKQSIDGSWGSANQIATTGLVLLKFVVRAQELGLDPFDNDPLSPTYYEYADNTTAGFSYLWSSASDVPIGPQTNGDPDTNVNGKGICFGDSVYYTGIALTALAISGHPDDRSATIGTLGLLTYREIAQDIADWLYFAQGDIGNDRGGFNYDALDNVTERTDNSNGGYAYLGLAFAEDPPFDCTVPDWVRDELNIYIDYIQNDVNGDTNDGGSGYDNPNGWVNILKTGNLIFEMAFYGDTPDTPRVQDAVNYLERHWQDPNTDPGWGYSLAVANYQAKFLVEKGLTYMGITELDTDGDGIDEDWFNQEPPAIPAQDIASVIVQQQLPSGSWPNSDWDGGDGLLSTAWAVLALEGFAPPRELARAPKAVFTESIDTPKVREQVRFDATSSQPGWNHTDIPITEYRWDFGDGNKTTTNTPVTYHSYEEAGIYYVTLTVYAPGTTPDTDTSPAQRKTVSTVPVGGYTVPFSIVTTATALTAYFALTVVGLASTTTVATVATAIYVRRVKRRKDNQ